MKNQIERSEQHIHARGNFMNRRFDGEAAQQYTDRFGEPNHQSTWYCRDHNLKFYSLAEFEDHMRKPPHGDEEGNPAEP